MDAVVAKGLRKSFGDVVAVDGVSLAVRRGEIFGFLGPNGAGKTTTIRMLTGTLLPDEGEVEILGMSYDSAELEIKRRIGVVPEEPPTFRNIRGWEFLQFVAAVYRCDDSVWTRVDELCQLMKIDFLDGFIDEYSHGMRQKLMVCSVLMRRPEVLFLDEPTTGLDPYSARALKLILRRLADEGAAVFMTTHILEIAEKMCDRLGVIVSGRMIACGTLAQLRQKAGTQGDLEKIFLQLTGADEEEIRRLVEEL